MGVVDSISNPVDPSILRSHVERHFGLSIQADLLRSGVYLNGLAPVNTNRPVFTSTQRLHGAKPSG